MTVSLFPRLELSNTEINLIAEALDNPSVKKYIQHQIYSAAEGIASGMPNEGESAEEYLRRLAFMRGQIAFAQALLSIEKVSASQQQSQ